MKRYLFLICLSYLCAVFPVAAQLPDECTVTYERITELASPDFTAYTVWDKIHGEKGMDQFADFILLPDGSVIAAGSYTKDETDKTYRPLIIKFDPKGKTIWEIRESTSGFKSIDRIVKLEKGFAIVGDIKDAKRRDGIYVGVYGSDGKKIRDIPLIETGGDLDAKAIVMAPDKKGFIIAAQFVPVKTGESGQYGVIYRLTSSGDVVWRRAYTPGMRTVFNNLHTLNDGSYAVTGDVLFDDGRQAGWLLRMDGSGTIQWQRTYPRGGESSLFAAARFTNGDMILSGRSRPVGGGLWAAWIMRVDTSGNTLWQHYFTSDYNMTGRQLLAQEKDERSTLLLDAYAQNIKQQTHARLAVFSPRGDVMNIEDFSQSMGGRGLSLHFGLNAERVVSGYAQTRLSSAQNPDEVEDSVFDGWIFASVSLDPYKDPVYPATGENLRMTHPKGDLESDIHEDDVVCVSVGEEQSGQRLDKALSSLCLDYSRTRLQALIDAGSVCVNGQRLENSKHKVSMGDVLSVIIPPAIDDTPMAENITIDIVYEDDDLLVINKQPGLTVHPGAGQHAGTLVNALLYHCGDTLSGIGGVKRPGIVHRLDKDTSGLMVVAKHDRAHHGLSAQLADRSLGRIYSSFVWRVPVPIKGMVEQPIGRHPTHRLKMAVRGRDGREAVTHYRVRESYGVCAAHVECVLESGRTHQIRVHMAYLKHPLLGDMLYGLPQQEVLSNLGKTNLKEKDIDIIAHFPRQALHAREIHFIHPISEEDMSFEIPLPEDLFVLQNILKKI